MKKTLYVLIGPQGSGKTYWVENILIPSEPDIVRVSQDDQGKTGHLELFEKSLKDGLSVVIDRMNFNFQQRDRYTQSPYADGYHIIFVLFNVRRETCLLRMASRKDHPTIAHNADHNSILNVYFSQFDPPAFDEYDELLTIEEKGYCSILDLQNVCYNGKVIVVGDIHGCFDEFMDLLNKCGYCEDDIVVATGDLVDRGPKIRETLEWFRNKPRAYTVEGNHDNKARRYWNGNPVKITNGLDKTIEQVGDNKSPEAKSLSAWMASWPQIIQLPRVPGSYGSRCLYVVHAGVDGRIEIKDQRTETCLYVRYLDGEDFSDSEKGMEWWKTLTGDYRVASGHIISTNPRPCPSAYCLDGGAHQGGELRALVIEGDTCEIFSVVSKEVCNG